MMPPHLWRCAGLRGHGGRLGRCLLAETLGLVPTGRPQEAAAQEIEVRAAKHLAFHHFQPVDVPLDRAGTPRQGDAGFDRLIVLAEPARKALQGLERTGSRALQPGIEALRLALAHELCKVLREVDRLSHRGMLLPELGELLRFGRGALGLTWTRRFSTKYPLGSSCLTVGISRKNWCPWRATGKKTGSVC